MHPLDAVVFDLDGTLWDTCRACATGWNNVLRRHGIRFREITADDIRSVAGRPHPECIRQVFRGLSEEALRVLTEETAEEDNRILAGQGGDLYPGVREGLAILERNWPLFIVSNCQAGYIETFLATSGLAALFRDFECWGNTGAPKAENLRTLIGRNRLRSPILVGDTAGDAEAARACGIPFAHVRYGFGEAPGADLAAGSFEALCAGLLQLLPVRAGARSRSPRSR